MTQKLLPTTELKPGMIVLAIIGFSSEFNSLTTQTAAWVSHNFSKAQAHIERGTENLVLDAAGVQPGDRLIRLDKLDALDRSFVVRSSALADEMMSKGLLLLLVDMDLNRKAAIQQKTLSQASQSDFIQTLLEKIHSGARLNAKLSKELTQTFDALRTGTVTKEQVEGQVEQILSHNGFEVLHLISLLEQNENVYQHSIDVAALYHSLYFDFIARSGEKPAFVRKQEVFLSAFVHDFGMARIPKEVYESTQKFKKASEEWKLLRRHPEEGAQILARMKMPESIINMALYHHTKIDSSLASHYPSRCVFEDATPEARLLSIIDIYQALTGKRSYSKNWTPPAAMRFLEALVGSEFDSKTWNIFYRLMGQYPNGSLVMLSSGESAFVVGQSHDTPDQPIVVPVLDSNQQRIFQSSLLFLELNKNVTVTEGLDAQAVLGKQALEVFAAIQLN